MTEKTREATARYIRHVPAKAWKQLYPDDPTRSEGTQTDHTQVVLVEEFTCPFCNSSMLKAVTIAKVRLIDSPFDPNEDYSKEKIEKEQRLSRYLGVRCLSCNNILENARDIRTFRKVKEHKRLGAL